MPMPTARLFFAIVFDEATQNHLKKLLRTLKKLPNSHNIRWEKLEKLHITLQFIAKVEQTQIALLTDFAQQNLNNFSSLEIQFTHLHYFPPTKHPHVLSLGIKPSPKLLQLATLLRQSIQATELTTEMKDFLPHLTLGRLKPSPPYPLFIENLSIKIPPLTVTEIILLQSVMTTEGSEYTPLKKFFLST